MAGQKIFFSIHCKSTDGSWKLFIWKSRRDFFMSFCLVLLDELEWKDVLRCWKVIEEGPQPEVKVIKVLYVFELWKMKVFFVPFLHSSSWNLPSLDELILDWIKARKVGPLGGFSTFLVIDSTPLSSFRSYQLFNGLL